MTTVDDIRGSVLEREVDLGSRAEVDSLAEGTDSPSAADLAGVDTFLEEQLGRVWLPGIQADIEYAGDSLGRLARSGTSEIAGRIGAGEAVDLVRRLEELSGVIVAAQARLAVVVDTHTRHAQAEAGLPAHRRGTGVASQLGLARRESPSRAAIRLGLATALTTELPATLEALASGETTEYRALMVARTTAVLEPDVRRDVDAVIGPELKDLSDRAVRSRVQALAYQADPRAFAAASERSAQERYVSIRPVPTVMAQVTGCVPAAEGVACWAALDSAARSAQAAGDERSLAQLRADLFVGRLTGRDPASAGPDIEIGIVITDQALLGGMGASGRDGGEHEVAGEGGAVDEPAHLVGYGPIPAPWARAIIRAEERDRGSVGEQQAFWRRLFTARDGSVQDIDTRRGHFSGALRTAIVYRDQHCRTPWCGAPLRQVDHVTGVADGGGESWTNGQGLCQTCNLAKEAPGWRADAVATGPPGQRDHVVTTTTPTGHSYVSRPPGYVDGRRNDIMSIIGETMM
ncbi:HNH endonuclease [Mobilicoccus caccae]|nr:HNH endonuclease signature motif containing protein [Mobilicoccus caccae]